MQAADCRQGWTSWWSRFCCRTNSKSIKKIIVPSRFSKVHRASWLLTCAPFLALSIDSMATFLWCKFRNASLHCHTIQIIPLIVSWCEAVVWLYTLKVSTALLCHQAAKLYGAPFLLSFVTLLVTSTTLGTVLQLLPACFALLASVAPFLRLRVPNYSKTAFKRQDTALGILFCCAAMLRTNIISFRPK